MRVIFNPKSKKVYELILKKDWASLLKKGTFFTYDIRTKSYFGVEVTHKSSPEAKAKKYRWLKRKGIIPYESLTELIEIEGVRQEESKIQQSIRNKREAKNRRKKE